MEPGDSQEEKKNQKHTTIQVKVHKLYDNKPQNWQKFSKLSS